MKTLSIFIMMAGLAAGCVTALAADGPGRDSQPHKKNICTGMWLEHTEGTTTTVTEKKDGVEVLITSTDPIVAGKLQADAGDYYAKKKNTDCACCSAAVPGADTAVKNREHGVEIAITAKAPAVVKEIKAKAGTMVRPIKSKNAASVKPTKKSVKWVCPMGEYESDKPSKCPKCGMTLVEKK